MHQDYDYDLANEALEAFREPFKEGSRRVKMVYDPRMKEVVVIYPPDEVYGVK